MCKNTWLAVVNVMQTVCIVMVGVVVGVVGLIGLYFQEVDEKEKELERLTLKADRLEEVSTHLLISTLIIICVFTLVQELGSSDLKQQACMFFSSSIHNLVLEFVTFFRPLPPLPPLPPPPLPFLLPPSPPPPSFL